MSHLTLPQTMSHLAGGRGQTMSHLTLPQKGWGPGPWSVLALNVNGGLSCARTWFFFNLHVVWVFKLAKSSFEFSIAEYFLTQRYNFHTLYFFQTSVVSIYCLIGVMQCKLIYCCDVCLISFNNVSHVSLFSHHGGWNHSSSFVHL